jgi:nicotinic acid mononucleotide adenylyltransferase
MEKLIKKIHQSDIYGVFIESGCGVPVASALLKVSGASDTIYMSENPYSRDYFAEVYGNETEPDNYRSVSPEHLSKVLNSQRFSTLFTKGRINIIYSATFQLGEMNDKSTHGWIGIKFKTLNESGNNYSLKYYHISIHEPLSRKEYIERIGENGLKLVMAGNQEVPDDCDVDIVLNEDLSPDYERTLNFIANLRTKEQFSIFYPDKIERMENITRNNESLILFKGSFNPVQNAHLHIIKRSEEKFPGAAAYFMISFNAVQKGIQSYQSIMTRIKLLWELGYGVIVCNNQYFKNNINFLRYKFPEDKPVILSMGLDTLSRLLQDYNGVEKDQQLLRLIQDFKNVKFFCMNRTGVELPEFITNAPTNIFTFEKSGLEELSSTKIRELLEKNYITEVKKIVPEKVFELLINEKWT